MESRYLASSTDGGQTFNIFQQTGPVLGPGRATCPDDSYFACMYTSPNGGYWREMGGGEPGVGPNGVVHYVYGARSGGDPGDIYYIRSTNNGATWSSPIRLNSDSTARAQWGPSLSVNAAGKVFVSWYDERNTVDDTLQRYGRASLDNGATWESDVAVSDVIFPKPLRPDPSFAQSSNAGLHNHAAFSDDGLGFVAYHTWTDGRVSINGQPQQDVFFKKLAFTPTTFTVTTTNEHSDGVCDAADCSLWDAITAANGTYDSVVTFAPGVTGTITTTLQNTGINILRPVNIIGPGARNLTISGSGTGRILNVGGGVARVKISGLTLANGKTPGNTFPTGYGGAIFNAGTLSLVDCALSGNVANVWGGAIYNNGQSGNAGLTLNNCTLNGNSASGSGGAIFSAAYSVARR